MSQDMKRIAPPDDPPPLDRWRLDEALEPNRPIWGLEAIARVLGLSVNKTRNLARTPGVPIYQPEGCGQHFAFRSELVAWLKGRKGA